MSIDGGVLRVDVELAAMSERPEGRVCGEEGHRGRFRDRLDPPSDSASAPVIALSGRDNDHGIVCPVQTMAT
jgi:hypothetical protein